MILRLTLCLVFLGLCGFSISAESNRDIHLNVPGGSPSEFIELYAKLSGKQPVIASNVDISGSPLRLIRRNMDKNEALQFIREELLKQARLILSDIDGKTFSVTFNDRLPMPQPK